MKHISKKIHNLINNLGFKKSEISEIIKFYRGETFNSKDPGFLKLLKKSSKLCSEYTKLFFLIDKNQFKNKKEKNKLIKKKNQILKMLFPNKGHFICVRDHVSLVAGAVDISSFSFLNSYATFPNTGLVKLGKYTTFGPKVTFLENKRNENNIKASLNIVERKCWLCAGVKVSHDVVVKHHSVIGAGAILQQDSKTNHVYVGRKNFKFIKIRKPNLKPRIIWDFDKNKLLKFIKQNYPIAIKEYAKSLDEKMFNSVDKGMNKLYSLTRQYCVQYTQQNKTQQEKTLNKIFPFHGKNLKVGKNISVDCLGSVVVGDNVTIGNNVFMAGKIYIGDNVKIGDNTILYASSHSNRFCDRMAKLKINGVFMGTFLGCINIKPNITIGKNSNIVINSEVTKDLPENTLYVNKNIIK